MAQETTVVRRQVADIIEPHIDGRFKVRERAEGCAEDLERAGLLAGGDARGAVTIQAQAEAILQCRLGWKTAEEIAAELVTAELLKAP